MEKSRTKNSIRNIKSAIVMQLFNKLLAFIVRTVFIKTLNTEYLGINGLFTNILSMLSFAELGIGTAIIFSMYKPVAEDDKEKIKSLMLLYKKAYSIVGIVIFILGILIIPFLKYLITNIPNIKENIILIYILFLFNTSVSYFFTYKKSIISAYQQESVLNRISINFTFIKSICEIFFLVFTRNYIIYLLISIFITIGQNFYISHTANKMFPFLKDKNAKPLIKKESTHIFNNVKSLVVYKLGGIILNGTDNIIISVMVSVSTVGLCSNYTLIINSVKNFITSFQDSITASLGNLNSMDDNQKKESTFYQLFFLNFWIYLIFSIMFIFLLNPLVELWLGKEYVLNNNISIALSVSFFIEGLRITAYMYRVTLGLFKKGKITPYLASIINIISSVILCKFFGVVGIFIGTSIAQLFSYSIIDPYIIYKYSFKSKMSKYFFRYFAYFTTFLCTIILLLIFNQFIDGTSVFNLLFKGILYFILINLIVILIYGKTTEFRELKQKIINIFKEKLKKI